MLESASELCKEILVIVDFILMILSRCSVVQHEVKLICKYIMHVRGRLVQYERCSGCCMSCSKLETTLHSLSDGRLTTR